MEELDEVCFDLFWIFPVEGNGVDFVWWPFVSLYVLTRAIGRDPVEAVL